jgi:hypothetical protein
MKKILLALALFSGGIAMNQAYGQESVKTEQNPLLTSIKPADGKPATFSSQTDLENTVPAKIAAIKEEILKTPNDTVRVNHLRQQLWRFENAIVIENR